jgi:hypothetical protein
MQANQSDDVRALLDEMAAIPTMERGKLTAEYRTGSAKDGSGAQRLGPYYKYQVWEDGRNVTRRIPAEQAGLLEADIANYNHFQELSARVAEIVIRRTRALREESGQAGHTAAKKNSTRKRAAKGSAKPRTSSRKPRRG